MFGHQDSNKDDKSKAGNAAGTRTVAPTAGSAPTSSSGGGLASSLASSIAPSAAKKPAPSTPPSLTGSHASSTPLAPVDLKDIEKDLADFESSSSSSPSSSASSSAVPKPPTPAPVIPAPSRGAPTASPAAASASPSPTSASTLSPSPVHASSDLDELKLTVLHELTPLVDQLEQTAEEHFRTLMMMIQSAEEQSLLPKAYETAHKIKSEKVRAQALLDVVNEINYFTQPHAEDEE